MAGVVSCLILYQMVKKKAGPDAAQNSSVNTWGTLVRKKPAPSNSRLSGTYRVHLHRISWDRMIIIGDLNPRRATSFRNLIANDPRIHFLNGGSDYFKARAYNELFYMEYDKQKGQAFERRNFRCEFNPNNCDEKAKSFFVEKILPNLKDVGFSRLDLAFDLTENLNDFLVMTDIPLKQTVIYGRDGAAETRYFGAQDSERFSSSIGLP